MQHLELFIFSLKQGTYHFTGDIVVDGNVIGGNLSCSICEERLAALEARLYALEINGTASSGGGGGGSSGGTTLGTQGNPATSCDAIHQADSGSLSGNYYIQPAGESSSFEAYCMMDTVAGTGGW